MLIAAERLTEQHCSIELLACCFTAYAMALTQALKQVGSKNAAFYLGKRIRVTTSHIRSKYVHELSIAASDLEQRYRDGKVMAPVCSDWHYIPCVIAEAAS